MYVLTFTRNIPAASPVQLCPPVVSETLGRDSAPVSQMLAEIEQPENPEGVRTAVVLLTVLDGRVVGVYKLVFHKLNSQGRFAYRERGWG